MFRRDVERNASCIHRRGRYGVNVSAAAVVLAVLVFVLNVWGYCERPRLGSNGPQGEPMSGLMPRVASLSCGADATSGGELVALLPYGTTAFASLESRLSLPSGPTAVVTK
jgi:hypothetical protein